MKTSACVLLVLLSLLASSLGASIFLIANLPSGSHAIWYGKLANVLAQRGHEVVLLGTGPFKQQGSGNIDFILQEDSYGWMKKVEQVLNETSLLDMVEALSTPTQNIASTIAWSLTECPDFIRSKGVQTVMTKYKNKKFDLIIADFICDSFYGFVPFFGSPPFILATPYANAFMVNDAVGVFDNPSYVPSAFSPFLPQMTFKERLLNVYYKIYADFMWSYVTVAEDKLSKEVFGQSTPHVADILRNASLVMIGTDPVLGAAKPMPPAFIPVGGFHISKVKPLPEDIKKFIDEAKDGVIYFSFGSNFKSIYMTNDMIQLFLGAFAEIPQRVVWKLELDNKDNIPNNVMISKWLPQNDILAHPNVRCFISHGGLLGSQEAIYHGVPVLGLSFMFDQHDVVEKLEKFGVGIRLEFHKLSKEYIKHNIQKIFEKSYRENMQERSKVFRDTPQTAEERVIWWIEYVLRNPTGTKKYLRLASLDLYWYQRLLLDVAAAVLLPILLLLYAIRLLFRKLFSKSDSKTIKTKGKSKKE